jgi:hypothetical protein
MRLALVPALAVAALVLTACSGAAPTAQVGECLDLNVDAAEVSELKGFDCETEHDVEVYFVGDSTQSDFDLEAVITEAQEICIREFESFVGIALEESTLDVYYLYPQSEGWAAGDREIICAVYTPNWDTGEVTRTTGSLKGAAV